MLKRLERQNGIADLARFSIPNEFNLALVLEEEKPIFLRQRPARVDELYKIALLGFRKFVAVVCLSGHVCYS